MKAILEQAQNLDIKQGTVSRVIHDARAVMGVETDMGIDGFRSGGRNHLRDIFARAFARRRK